MSERPDDVRTLIRTMADANPLWGAPRIHGELLKLGINVCQATVAKYMGRQRRPPSQTWRTFLKNHLGQIVAADFFVVPTVTCRLMFVLVLLAPLRVVSGEAQEKFANLPVGSAGAQVDAHMSNASARSGDARPAASPE